VMSSPQVFPTKSLNTLLIFAMSVTYPYWSYAPWFDHHWLLNCFKIRT